MRKQLVLIRHAHRDTENRSMDNGLSEKGFRQAKWLRRFADLRFKASEVEELHPLILSSPKRRCIETVGPMAELLKVSPKIEPLLDEKRADESMSQFNERIHRFMDWWVKEAPAVVIACSHGDWLPLAVFYISGFTPDMKKGAWLELEWQSGRAKLSCLIPSLIFFRSEMQKGNCYLSKLNRIPSRRAKLLV